MKLVIHLIFIDIICFLLFDEPRIRIGVRKNDVFNRHSLIL
jgi:hypothetical protein